MSIILKNRREPRICIPSTYVSASGTCFTGVLKGYYVAETNYYNVLPSDACIDERYSETLGYVFYEDITPWLSGKVAANLLSVKLRADRTQTLADRFRDSLKKRENQDEREDVLASWKTTIGNLLRDCPGAPDIEQLQLVGYWDSTQCLHIIQIETMMEVVLEPYALKLDVFSRNTGILESAVMLEKGALFIGCGSVGSLVAVELAKAGVGRFMLVDSDIFGYHNICRHQCGIYDVGRYKTDALEKRILQINPYAKVIKRNMMIQEVDRSDLEAFCDQNTIVVGGADNREGDLYACNFAVQVGAAFISVGCWERAFAGEIFYCLPQGMPTYKDFLAAAGYSSGRVTQNRRFYTSEEDLEKVSFEPGISADINFITIIAVKLMLDILNRDTPGFTQRLLPYLTQYTLICNTNSTAVGGEQAEIFSYPLQVTTSINVPYSSEENG